MKFKLTSVSGNEYLSEHIHNEIVRVACVQYLSDIIRYGPKGYVTYKKGEPVYDEYWSGWLRGLKDRPDIENIVEKDSTVEWDYLKTENWLYVDTLEELIDYLEEVGISFIISKQDDYYEIEIYDSYKE